MEEERFGAAGGIHLKKRPNLQLLQALILGTVFLQTDSILLIPSNES